MRLATTVLRLRLIAVVTPKMTKLTNSNRIMMMARSLIRYFPTTASAINAPISTATKSIAITAARVK